MTPKSPITTPRLSSRIRLRASKRLAALAAVVFAIAGVVLVGGSLTSGDPALASALPKTLNQPSVLVASLNIAMVRDADEIVHELAEHPVLRDADLFLMQEVVDAEKTGTTASV